MLDESEWRRKVRTAPLIPLAIAASAGVVLDRFVDPWGTLAWGLLAMVGAWAAAIGWHRPRFSTWAIALAFVALGGGWHHTRWSDMAPDDPARADWSAGLRQPAWVRGVIVDGPAFREGEQGPTDRGSTRAVLALTGICDGLDWHPASGYVQAWVAGDRSDLAAGKPVEAAGDLSAIEGPLNPGEVDFRPILRARGIRLRLSVGDPSGLWPDPSGRDWPWHRRLGAVRAWSARKLASGLDPDVSPLASALLLGRREAVDPEVNDAFARTGTTHLLAISGLHLQVLALAIGGVARALGLGRKGSYVIVIAGTVAYALLVGLMPSVVRSAAMTCGACLAGWRDRCVGPANLLAGAALATLALNPSDLFDVGCQLSFVAVAAILWLVPGVLAWDHPVLSPLDVLERQYEPWWRFLGRVGLVSIRDGLRASAVIWLVAWPLVALRFHLVSPIGILINIPLIPLTSAALLLAGLSLGFSAVWSPLGIPFAWATGWALGWTEAAVRWGTSWRWGHAFVPGPPWAWVLAFYALGGLALMAGASRWRSSRRWWALAIGSGAFGAILPMIPIRPEVPEAEILAVGHGLSVAIRSTGGQTVLYDAGKMGDPHVGRRVIAPALWSRGARRIDAMILTHADSDHYNGLPDLLDRFEIGVVRVPPGFESPANPGAKILLDDVRSRGIPVLEIARGDRLDLAGGPTLEVLQPHREASPGSTDNARSVVLEVASGGHRLLLTGDLEGDGLTDLVKAPAPRPLGAMLAPHHGGRTSNPAWLYDWADPALVVSSQRDPSSGSRDPLAPLAEGRFAILRTWESGAIRMLWTPSGLAASGFLDPKPASHP
ncbi:ComEC/Rec2 family competence protein [Tundrisphaera lichenicola]|uniref:ComEC/Rec2 family competence protein n=1 Tax=Tundrisphaera lichenicola TaxID=2029860 RepID=UPI003EBCFD61